MFTTRRLDPHAALRVTPLALQRYRGQALALCNWVFLEGFSPDTAEEWDAVMIDYKNRSPQLRKHDFSTLLVSLEFFFPEAKGNLAMSHACLRGWEIS